MEKVHRRMQLKNAGYWLAEAGTGCLLGNTRMHMTVCYLRLTSRLGLSSWPAMHPLGREMKQVKIIETLFVSFTFINSQSESRIGVSHSIVLQKYVTLLKNKPCMRLIDFAPCGLWSVVCALWRHPGPRPSLSLSALGRVAGKAL